MSLQISIRPAILLLFMGGSHILDFMCSDLRVDFWFRVRSLDTAACSHLAP